MKEINLTQGQVALVDDEDFEYLNQFKWCVTKSKNLRTFYAQREYHSNTIIMHRVIMGTPKGTFVDHIDHNGLNNQKSNLRNITPHQSAFNRQKPNINTTSKYKGVCYDKGHFKATIKKDGKSRHIGSFKTEFEAALAYDIMAKELFGEFACLNFTQ